MTSMVTRLAAGGAATLIPALLTASQAAATPPGPLGCGTTMSTSTTLTTDVGPCQGDGVIIGADNVTLDLNGHRIIGSVGTAGAAGAPGAQTDTAGVRVVGRTGVTVTDSSVAASGSRGNAIKAFNDGVIISGGSGNSVSNLNLTGNLGFTTTDFGEGVGVYDSCGNTIANNVLVGDGPYAGITLLRNSCSNTVVGNSIAADAAANQDIGIRLESGTSPASCPINNVLDSNRISGSSIDGISIMNGSRCDASGNTIRANTIVGNGRDGVRLNARCFATTSTTVVAPCTVPGQVPHGALNNTVTDNTVCGNGGAGIRATAATTANSITNNQSGDMAAMRHSVGGPAPCSPNNPDTSPVTNPATGQPASTSPLLPPHGDLDDGNGTCSYNAWSANRYTTKTPSCIS